MKRFDGCPCLVTCDTCMGNAYGVDDLPKRQLPHLDFADRVQRSVSMTSGISLVARAASRASYTCPA
uniref:Uncharacterized protein n=1 Tax=Arion vulgaris TaxID=1028688 RepID=A0A0B7BP11_9EUPU